MTLKEKIAKRNSKRGQITKIFNDVTIQNNLDSKTKPQKVSSLEKLMSIKEDLAGLDESIFELTFADTEESTMTAELEKCSDYEDKLLEAIAILKDSVNSENSELTPKVIETSSNLLKGHHVPLPVFSNGEG